MRTRTRGVDKAVCLQLFRSGDVRAQRDRHARMSAGGQVGVAQHLNIGDGAMIAGRSAVISHIPQGAVSRIAAAVGVWGLSACVPL